MTSTAKVTLTHPAPIYTEGQEMADEITTLSAYITAATYRLLILIREFDEKGFWQLNGILSCAHWLNFQCGIGMNAAREKVRVARALKDLPLVSEAFKRGELSYSKARAITRIANNDNEEYLIMIARHGTAHHVEKLVSKYRHCKRLQDVDNTNQQHALRKLSYHYDETGSLILNGRFPAEQGALIIKALEMAVEQADAKIEKESTESPQSDDEATPPKITAETRPRESFTIRRADALAEIAETYLNNGSTSAPTADRYQVVVHVSGEMLKDSVDETNQPGITADTLKDNAIETNQPKITAVTRPHINAEMSHIEDATHVTAETSRRIACDCSVVGIIEDEAGEPLSIGRKTRSIPPAMRRALRSRDQGCRFPGCTHTQFIDGHHIQHWADGGDTSLHNLLQLCRHHHRLVHEGGITCERLESGRIVFRNPCGEEIAESPAPMTLDDADEIDNWMHAIATEHDIDHETCVPRWYAGEKMDWNLAVGYLFR